jgi:hypothetical protein
LSFTRILPWTRPTTLRREGGGGTREEGEGRRTKVKMEEGEGREEGIDHLLYDTAS